MANKNIFCSVPWTNTHLYWDGTYGACCFESSKPTGTQYNIQNTNIVQWYNSDTMKNFRQRILSDNPLSECSSCYHEEKHGHESRRIKENFKTAIFTELAFDKSYQQSPWYDIFQDPTNHTDSLPIDWHIDFGNECNLSCKMCGPDASSQIANQYNKWNIDFTKKSNWVNNESSWIQFLENIKSVKNLRRVHVMGGEPVINKHFHKFIDWLIEHDFTNLSFSFVSNGTIINTELVSKLKKFQSTNIEISIESIADINHYIRQGSDTKQILKNIDYLLEQQSDTFQVVLRSVPQLLNVNEYYNYIRYAFNKRVSVQSIPLITPSYLSIGVLPFEIRQRFIKNYQEVKQEILNNSEEIVTIATGRDPSRLNQQLIRECDSIIALLSQPTPKNVIELRKELIMWMKRWDTVYNLNALEFYPEYKDFFTEYGYSN